MSIRSRLPAEDLERIREAVEQAERRTSGEIVTYIVGECDEYPEAAWRAGAVGAVLGMGGGWAVRALSLSEVWLSPLYWLVLPSLATALVGLGLGLSWDPLRRRLIDRDTLSRRVGLRAEAAFLEEEVFDTRERTGILLFVALFEHRVLVLGDAGINARVEPGDWVEIVDHMVEELRAGRPAEALVRGVEDCGELLATHRVERRVDDSDELDNRPRLRER